jgi:micrococcal nuclease
MQNNAKAPIIVETHLVITEVIDGDSIKVASIFNKDEKEIRLYGIDCPENKYNRKMVEDEKKLHTPAEFLLGLGQQAHKFVLSVAPVGTSITLQIEKGNELDHYKRHLAYVILPDGSCLNEIIVAKGYARATGDYFCEELPKYQALQLRAMQNKQGLYRYISRL